MPSILIISPDPDTRRMLSLAFELEGFSVTPATDASDPSASGAKADIALLDMVEFTDGQGKPARSAGRRLAGKTAVLLPRGSGGQKAQLLGGGADLAIYKPCELLDVVDRVKKMSQQEGTVKLDQPKKTGRVNTPRKSSSSHRKPRRRS